MSGEKESSTTKAPDRSIAPDIHDIQKMELSAPTLHRLKNGVPVHEVHGGSEALVKLELMLQAGTKYQEEPGLANAAIQLIDKGSAERNANEIAEAMEYYGISFEQRVDRDHAWFGFYVLNEHFDAVLGILQEILEKPAFPEKELAHYVAEEKDELLEEQEKVSFLARKRFMPVIFGETHPYGRTLEGPDDLDRLDRERISAFYEQRCLQQGQLNIFLSGKTENWMIERLDARLGGIPEFGKASDPLRTGPSRPSEEKEHHVQKDGALQAALRIGNPLFGREHPDFPGMMLLSTILGGYFGSRLMMNIREDKGYTYGIGSAVMPLQDSGFFAIATEVGTQVREAAMQEIRKELARLSEEKVSREELDHVRRYMQGTFLRRADGPFAKADLFKNVHRVGLDLSFYDRLMDTLHSITPEQLQELARKHLNPEELRTVIAGDLNA